MVRHFLTKHGKRKQATGKWLTQPSQFKGTTYIQGTRTKDNCRFAKTKHLPLKLHFTDSTNTEHEIVMEKISDQYTITFTCNGEIYWFGDEKDRTGFDAQCKIVQVTFTYIQGGMFHSHGIRVSCNGYKPDNMNYYKSDTEAWDSAIDLFIKSTEGAKNVVEIYNSLKG